MKNSLNNNKKFDFSKISIDTIIDFCKNNTRYVSAGVLTLILAVVLAVTAVNDGKTENAKKAGNKTQQTADASDAYEVNKNEELNKTISSYYKHYADGKVKKLAKIATPVSDMEKSYIKMMSKYVESYSEINCYTKKGLEKGSYMVSATYEMKFKGVDTTAPGMDFFYVRTNKDGKLYIDNLYSSFNNEMKEQEQDAKIIELIEKFKAASDVQELQADFQKRYTEAVSADKKLQDMVNTVTEGIKNWATSYVADEQAQQEEAKKKEEEEKKKAEEAKKKEEEEKKKAEEQKKKEEEEKKKAEEAKQQEEQEPEQNNSGLNYIQPDTVLTATDGYNIRKSMSETAELVGTTAIGDKMTVVLSYEEGWTKVKWNGKTGFVRTDLLLAN